MNLQLHSNIQKVPVQRLQLPRAFDGKLKLSVLREDLVHPFLSGNKRRKLKNNLSDFRDSGKRVLVTFGGKYSNHLVATAAAGRILNFPAIGVLRGEEDVSNPNIEFLKNCGMKLLKLGREEYRLRNNKDFLKSLSQKCADQFPEIVDSPDDIFIVPEGGANEAGVKGCEEILADVPPDTTYVCTATGTGSTLAGIARACGERQTALGISVLRGESFLMDNVRAFGVREEKVRLIHDYHFGGYAKRNAELMNFCETFSRRNNIPIEPVYTGKLFYGVFDLINKNYFSDGSHIVLIHTGGYFNFDKEIMD